MIPYKDQIKLSDFREAYRKIINPDNDKTINEIINALFYNVECIYEEYQSTVPYIPASKEQYNYHILKPVDGRYTLIDFLLNRAISNIDCIRPCNQNAYDHRKALLINTSRYEQYRSNYSEVFIKQQYYKSKLHETGHALHVHDTKRDYSIHTLSDAKYLYPNSKFANFYDKLYGFEKLLGSKYPNMLHLSEISNATKTSHTSVSNGYPFANHDIDETATEYFATKYSGLYKDTSNFGITIVGEKKPKLMAITSPNHLNGYAHSSKFIYHLENLVSKPAMFESTFFESDIALREFSKKYASEIEEVWKTNPNSKDLPFCSDSFSKFQYLFQTACNHKAKQSSENIQRQTMIAHQVLDGIFMFAYKHEFDHGNISTKRMLDISKLSFYLSPLIFDRTQNQWIDTPIRTWYRDNYKIMKNALSADSQSPTGR